MNGKVLRSAFTLLVLCCNQCVPTNPPQGALQLESKRTNALEQNIQQSLVAYYSAQESEAQGKARTAVVDAYKNLFEAFVDKQITWRDTQTIGKAVRVSVESQIKKPIQPEELSVFIKKAQAQIPNFKTVVQAHMHQRVEHPEEIPPAPPVPLVLPTVISPKPTILSPGSQSSRKKLASEISLGMLMPRQLPGEDASVVHPSRTLLIFLDDSEKELDAITDRFITALSQEAGPILVSGSLLQNVFHSHMDEKTFKQNTSIIKRLLNAGTAGLDKIDKQMLGQQTNEFGKLGAFTLTMIAKKFIPAHWLVTQINPHLFLLTPKALVPTESNAPSINKFSERELALGLCIDHGTAIESTEVLTHFTHYKQPETSSYFMPAVGDQKTASSIFVTRTDYNQLDEADKKKFPIPQWSIYLAGHGYISEAICNLSIEEFKQFLTFLDTKILTKLFVYDSCHAAGINTSMVYEDLESFYGHQRKTYPFPIIISTTADISVFHITGGELSLTGGTLSINFYQHFGGADGFVNQTNSTEPVDFYFITQPIFPAVQRILSSANTTSVADLNYPMIRSANREAFISLLPGIEIGTVMANNRTELLNVLETAKKRGVTWKTTHVLLSTNHTPFTLILSGFDKTSPSVLFSAIPGATAHIINRIESDLPIKEFLKAQLQPRYGARKNFWIRSYARIKDGKKLYERSDVIIDSETPENTAVAYFTEANNRFEVSKNGSRTKIKWDYTLDYPTVTLTKIATLRGDTSEQALQAIARALVSIALAYPTFQGICFDAFEQENIEEITGCLESMVKDVPEAGKLLKTALTPILQEQDPATRKRKLNSIYEYINTVLEEYSNKYPKQRIK